jgi:4-amino-4-deoxy-L-arabinose transferase
METAAMYAFVEGWSRTGTDARRWYLGMWLAWGLAFMTKGPPGLLPLLAMTLMLLFHDRGRLRDVYRPTGVLLFLIVGFTWFGLIVAQDPSRLGYFLGYEVYDRVFTSTHDRNAQWYGAFKVYLPMLLAGALPWLVFATIAAGGPGAGWRTLHDRLRERNPHWRLLAYWLLVPLAVLFLARSRLQLYVLPLFVPMALVMARPLARWPGLEGRRGWRTIGVTALVLLGIKATLAHWPSNRDSRELAAELRPLLTTHEGDELIFVGMRPFYGLNLYLHQRIDGIEIDAARYDYSTRVTAAQLCGEIARRTHTVYVLKAHHAPAFEERLRACRFVPTRIGSVHADDNDLDLLTVRTGALQGVSG